MAKAKMVVLSNPISGAREADFNEWYNSIHAPEVVALPGFKSMTRYRALSQTAPPADPPTYQYLAVYELDDAELAMSNLAKAAPRFSRTDAVDRTSMMIVNFEPVFVYEKE
ncbi:MAG: hypothetical protein AB7F94_14860 [Nitrospira sp.]